MRRLCKSSLLCLSVLLLFSCADSGEQGEAQSHAERDAHHPRHEVSEDDHGLTLNGDEKWEMDQHTRDMFVEMVATFEDGGRDANSIKATGEKMEGQIDELIRGCTMKGEAHDQLHKYLVAYIPAVQTMARGGTQAQADSLAMLLALYPKYFE